MVAFSSSITQRLNARREKLGISCALLAKRLGVSLRTVQRILSGEEMNPGFATIHALARELGLGVRLDEETDIRAVRRRQAEHKADRLLAIVQGTSALEGQAMDRETVADLREKTIHELLAGPNRKLWAD